MRIANNIMAMNTHRFYTNNNSAVSKAAEKLSSGYRINRAGDDAAGLAISEKMRAQIRGLNMAKKNSQDAVSMVQTAEGALQGVHSMLQRMNQLAVQAATGTNDIDSTNLAGGTTKAIDRKSLQQEFENLQKEINQVADSTNFNQLYMLKGEGSAEATQATMEATVEDFPTATTANTTLAAGAADLKKDAIKTAIEGIEGLEAGDKEITFALNDAKDKVEMKVGDAVIGEAAIDLTADPGLGTAAGDQSVDLVFKTTGDTPADLGKVTLTTANGKAADEADVTAQLDELKTNVKIAEAAAADDAADGAADTGKASFTVDLAGAELAAGKKVSLKVGAAETPEVTGTAATANGQTDNDAALAKLFNGAEITIGGTKYTASVKDGETKVTFTAAEAGEQEAANIPAKDDAITFSGTDAADAGTKAPTQTALAETDITQGSDTAANTPAAPKSGDYVIQVGAEKGAELTISIKAMDADTLGVGLGKVDISTQKSAQDAIAATRDAINAVSEQRAELGAMQNRLEYKIDNLANTAENLSAAESRIRDVDIAEEMTNFTKNNILSQAATAMLAQANALPQNVLSLLQ